MAFVYAPPTPPPPGSGAAHALCLRTLPDTSHTRTGPTRNTPRSAARPFATFLAFAAQLSAPSAPERAAPPPLPMIKCAFKMSLSPQRAKVEATNRCVLFVQLTLARTPRCLSHRRRIVTSPGTTVRRNHVWNGTDNFRIFLGGAFSHVQTFTD